jgi:predicted transcriptional regulator
LITLSEYITILKIIAHQNPVNPVHVTPLENGEYEKLAVALTFLENQRCIKLEKPGQKTLTAYSITERGLRILKFFNQQTT